MTRTNLSGPTVHDFQRAAPASVGPDGRQFPTPVETGGPFPYWFTLRAEVGVGFLRCGDDARCDRWVMFTPLEPMSQDEGMRVQGLFYEPLSGCDAFPVPDVSEQIARVPEINPQGHTLVRVSNDIVEGSDPRRLDYSADSFGRCLTAIRATLAEMRRGE